MSLNLPSIPNSSSSININVTPTTNDSAAVNIPSSLSMMVNIGTGTGQPLSSSSTSSSNFTNSLMVKKDLVLSPLTRIAKGMQSLGINLRSSSNVASSNNSATMNHDGSDADTGEMKKRKLSSQSRIIEM